MTDRTLSLLGLARRGGYLVLGEEPVGEACGLKRARVILLASDAGDSTARRAERLAERNGIPLAPLPYTKAELGNQMGRASCALAALTDLGLAAETLERLAAGDESLRSAADALAEKARRGKRRRGEGKRKPGADQKSAGC